MSTFHSQFSTIVNRIVATFVIPVKRYFVIPVILLYMLAVCGVLINVHYCGQQLASWNVYLDTEGCAGACGNESDPDHNCCKDETVTVKVSEDHSISSWKYKFSGEEPYLLPAALTGFPEVYSHLRVDATVIAHLPQPPPGIWQDIPLYKLFSRLTYYG